MPGSEPIARGERVEAAERLEADPVSSGEAGEALAVVDPDEVA